MNTNEKKKEIIEQFIESLQQIREIQTLDSSTAFEMEEEILGLEQKYSKLGEVGNAPEGSSEEDFFKTKPIQNLYQSINNWLTHIFSSMLFCGSDDDRDIKKRCREECMRAIVVFQDELNLIMENN